MLNSLGLYNKNAKILFLVRRWVTLRQQLCGLLATCMHALAAKRGHTLPMRGCAAASSLIPGRPATTQYSNSYF